MASPTLQLVVSGAVFTAILVFAGAFRFALRECSDSRDVACQPDLPRAAIHGGARRWSDGSSRRRLASGVRLVQAGFVAVGITAVFVMTMCMAGIVGLMLFG